jgi:hypothetical protein
MLLYRTAPPSSLCTDALMGEGQKGVGGGANSFDGEKAWSFINHSILSGVESMGVGLSSYTQKLVFNPDLRNPRNVTGVGDQLAQPLIPCYRGCTDKLYVNLCFEHVALLLTLLVLFKKISIFLHPSQNSKLPHSTVLHRINLI